MDLRKINIEFIHVDEMRYPSAGDYFMDENGVMQIRIARMGKEIHSMAVLVHELTEYAILRHKGEITTEMIDAFDFEFEERRKRKEVGQYDEPGMADDCPYKNEHAAATIAEMAVIAGAGQTWSEYEEKINNLF